MCDSAEDWKTWFHLSYPGCRKDDKWVENNFKNDGVKLVKEETALLAMVRFYTWPEWGIRKRSRKWGSKQQKHFGSMQHRYNAFDREGETFAIGFSGTR